MIGYITYISINADVGHAYTLEQYQYVFSMKIMLIYLKNKGSTHCSTVRP